MLASIVVFAGGKMAYGAIDAIGGAMSPKVVKSLRKSGKYMLYGALDPTPVSASNGDILAQTKVSPSNSLTTPDYERVLSALTTPNPNPTPQTPPPQSP